MENKKLRKQCAEEFFALQGEISKYIKKFDGLAERAKEAGDEELAQVINKVANDIRMDCVQKWDDVQDYLNGFIDVSFLKKD